MLRRARGGPGNLSLRGALAPVSPIPAPCLPMNFSRTVPTPFAARRRRALPALLCAAAAVPAAAAPADVQTDGRWRATLGAAWSASSGNTSATSVQVDGDAVRATPQDRWRLTGRALYGRSDGVRSADQLRLGTKYDWQLPGALYAFGTGDVERDPIAALASRWTLGSGLGWRLLDRGRDRFEVFGGLAYAQERYTQPRFVRGALRTRDDHPSALLGQESAHALGSSTTLQHKLVVYPDLRRDGNVRAQWDAGLAVAMTQALNLTVGLAVKHSSDPGPAVKRTDTLWTTGVALRFH